MDFETLFKVVVVGGSVLAGGCASKTASTSTQQPAVQPTDTTEVAVDCDAICTGPEGRERFCPDPSNEGIENCCWLMTRPHECCPN